MLTTHVFSFNVENYGGENDSEEEYTGFSTLDKGKAKATQEYEDEEQLATVTVVEEFDPGSFLHPPPLSRSSQISNKAREDTQTLPGPTSSSLATPKKTVKKRKAESKKIAYETKAARKAARVKQRARKLEKAELAGGKSKRKQRKAKKRS